MNETLEKQLAFIMELDKIKNITRQTYISDGSRKENDAEHSWHLALMCFVLAEYSNEPIDAGDTYAYDVEGNKTKRERELRAAERIYAILPDEQAKEYRALWDEFEAMETPEAKFANVLDKLQPLLLNDATNGIAWEEHGIKASQVLKRNARVHEGSEELWEYAKALIQRNVDEGHLIDG